MCTGFDLGTRARQSFHPVVYHGFKRILIVMERSTYLVLLACVCVTYGSRILVVFPMPANSHANLGNGFVRHLLKAGHQVTYITPYPSNTTEPNLRRIIVDDTLATIPPNALNIDVLMQYEIKLNYDDFYHMMYNVSRAMLEQEALKNLIKDPREHFDVVIAEWMFNDLYSGFSAVFNCPYIWFFPFEPNFITLSLIDEASNPAYTPDINFNFVPPFTFMQRLEMLWYQLKISASSTFNYRSMEEDLYKRAFHEAVTSKGRDLPPYDEIRLNSSLALGNTHVSLGINIKLPQNFKSIGGYHIDTDVKPFPLELKTILDNSKDGFIYFSMGSNLKSKDFSDEIKTGVLKLFSTLKQTVIWKFEESLPNLPKNVHILKWAPQQGILAHPNCHLFITHGGLLSTTEAVHFGIPIIGIPVFFDQYTNIDRAVHRGFARKVVLSKNLTRDLKAAIEEITINPLYKENVKELSFVYHNRPAKPGQEMVHWVEHVIATRGAAHLRSPILHVPLYQKLYLDLLALVALAIFIVQRIIVFHMFTSKRNKSGKKKNA